jgi:hypothetical protein
LFNRYVGGLEIKRALFERRQRRNYTEARRRVSVTASSESARK